MRNWRRAGYGESAASMGTVLELLRTAQELRAGVDAVLKPLGIGFARYEVLALLMFSRSGAVPMHSISGGLGVHPASVTAAVAKLVDDGLAQRHPDPDDGRGSLISLTDSGIILMTQATADLDRYLSRLGLTEEERRQIVQIHRRVSP